MLELTMRLENIVLGMIYVTGGVEGVNSSSEVIRYSRLQGIMRTTPPIIERRHAHAVAANDETISVLDGRKHLGGGLSNLSTCEYHFLSGRRQFTNQFCNYPSIFRWNVLPRMNRARWHSKAIWIPQHGIFVLGGYKANFSGEYSVELLRKSSSGYAFECTYHTHLLETSRCLLVAQVNERVFVHNANQPLPRFQMLNLKYIPNEKWTCINCSIPLNEAFVAWSMTATIDGILLSGLLDISAL